MIKKSKRGTSSVDVIIGQNLKNMRTQRGLSQSALGDQLNITFQQIQKYEKGTNRVAASTLLEMTKILGVSIESFFQGAEPLPSADAVPVPLLSSQAYRLAVLYDKNKNPAFKKAVTALVQSTGAGGDDDERTQH